MIEIAALLGVAAAGFGAAHALRMPVIPFLLAAGLALGTVSLLGEGQLVESLLGDQDFVQDVLMLGATLLLFVAGTDLSARRVDRYKKLALEIGLVQFVALAASGLAAATLLGYVLVDSLYIGLALAASSTLVGVRLLQKRRQMFEPFGRVVTGVLLVQDLLVVVLMAVLTQVGAGPDSMLAGLGGTLILGLLALLMVQYVAPALIVEGNLDNESLLLIVLSTLFGFIGLGSLLLGSAGVIPAAFLAGVALSGFPVSGLVHGQLRPIYDFFLAVFFTALGVAIVTVGSVHIGHALIFSLVVLLVTPPLVVIIAERSGLSARPAIESGLLLAQTSEFSLVVVLYGLVLDQIGTDLFATLALTTVITMMLTPVLTSDRVVWQLMRWHPLSREPASGTRPHGHLLLLGAGRTARPVLDALVASDVDLVVIEEDPATINQLREQGITCIRGDAADPAVLRDAGVHRARAVVSMIRRPLNLATLFRYVDANTPVLVRVFEDEEAEAVRTHGGTPISFAHATANAFFDWFDATFPESEAA